MSLQWGFLRHLLRYHFAVYASGAGLHPLLWILMAGLYRPVYRNSISYDVRQGAEGGLRPVDGTHHGPHLLCHRAIHRCDPGILRSACGLAEITRVITHYRSMAGNLVSFVLFSVAWWALPLPIWLMREDFLRQITEQGMPADYVNTLAALSSSSMLVVLFLAPVVGAIIGGFIARAMFRKHFEKAGLV